MTINWIDDKPWDQYGYGLDDIGGRLVSLHAAKVRHPTLPMFMAGANVHCRDAAEARRVAVAMYAAAMATLTAIDADDAALDARVRATLDEAEEQAAASDRMAGIDWNMVP